MMRLNITRKSEDAFVFSYYQNSDVVDGHTERAQIVRLLDEAIDALMSYEQEVDGVRLNSTSSVCRITLRAGGIDAQEASKTVAQDV